MKIKTNSLILLIYSLLIFFLSTLPLPEQKTQVPSLDKIIHMLIYFFMAILALRSFRKLNNPLAKSFLYTFCFGLIIELVQYFIPYRGFDLYDILANSLGLFLGLFFYRKFI